LDIWIYLYCLIDFFISGLPHSFAMTEKGNIAMIENGFMFMQECEKIKYDLDCRASLAMTERIKNNAGTNLKIAP
jgi:hypothetical protein